MSELNEDKRTKGVYMKKRLILLGLLAMIGLTGCNKQIVDFTYSYDRVIMQMPDGTIIDGKVQSWTDYKDGDQIQVRVGGKQYLIHSEDVVLISN